MSNIKIIIVDKCGTLKETTIKDFREDKLYKKCGFKTIQGFEPYGDWCVKINNTKYYINVYGKTNGKASSENKYDLPPPVDNTLFFGNCLVVAYDNPGDFVRNPLDLSLPMWKNIYEKLFGGFYDLTETHIDDDAEEDELDNIPSECKTKDGYLKDGFVVSDECDESGSGESPYIVDSGDDSDDTSSMVSVLLEEEYIEED
jgi:hypothetical protein